MKLRRWGLLILLSLLMGAAAACAGEEPETVQSSSAIERQAGSSQLSAAEEVQEETEMKMKLEIAGETFTATLENNSSVEALGELLEQGPLTFEMEDYAGREKGAVRAPWQPGASPPGCGLAGYRAAWPEPPSPGR